MQSLCPITVGVHAPVVVAAVLTLCGPAAAVVDPRLATPSAAVEETGFSVDVEPAETGVVDRIGIIEIKAPRSAAPGVILFGVTEGAAHGRKPARLGHQ